MIALIHIPAYFVSAIYRHFAAHNLDLYWFMAHDKLRHDVQIDHDKLNKTPVHKTEVVHRNAILPDDTDTVFI